MKEKELMETKWFDYRALAPDVATLVFMNEWAKAFCNYNERLGKTRHFYFLKSFERFDLGYLKNKTRFGYFTKLRQWADSHRMRYDLYWAWAFEVHENLGYGRTFESIFLGKRIKAGVLQKQKDFERDILIYSQHEIFRPDNYADYEIQDDYYWYLVDEVKKRNPKDRWLTKIKELITIDRIPNRFFMQNRVSKCLID